MVHRVVGSYAELRAGSFANVSPYVSVAVLGRRNPHDGGGGIFIHGERDGAVADDAGTILQDTKGACWRRLFTGPIDCRWFGVVANDVAAAAANTDALQRVRAYVTAHSGATVQLPPGIVWVDRTVDFEGAHRLHLIGEPTDHTLRDGGSWIRITSAVPHGSTVLNMNGAQACALTSVGLHGLDERGVYRASRGLSLGAIDGSHVVFDVQVDRLSVYGVAWCGKMRGLSRTSNLAESVNAIPAVSLTGLTGKTGDGLSGLSYPLIEITLAGALGVSEFRCSLNGGKTWVIAAAARAKTAELVAIPGTSLYLKFSAGDYATDYFYEGNAYGIYIGSREDAGIDTQADTVTVSNYRANGVASAVFIDSSQAIGICIENPSISTSLYGVVYNAASHVEVIGGQVSSNADGRACFQIRRQGGYVTIRGVYSEFFGGEWLSAPACARAERTVISACRVKMSSVPPQQIDGREQRFVDYNQGGLVIVDGTDWLANGGASGSVSWVGAVLVPTVYERASHVGSVTRNVVNATYTGHSVGALSGYFGNRTQELINAAISFGPLMGSNAGHDAELPPSALFLEDSTNRLTLTASDRARALQLLAEASIGEHETAIMIRRRHGGGFVVQKVTLGPKDWAGLGYQPLRVPNGPGAPSEGPLSQG